MLLTVNVLVQQVFVPLAPRKRPRSWRVQFVPLPREFGSHGLVVVSVVTNVVLVEIRTQPLLGRSHPDRSHEVDGLEKNTEVNYFGKIRVLYVIGKSGSLNCQKL